MLLLDTNFLLRMGDSEHAQHDLSLASMTQIIALDVQCVIVPQVLYEYWVVATRPILQNGLGLATPDADSLMTKWTALFSLLPDPELLLPTWRTLVLKHDVKGKTAHDARLVAAMICLGLPSIVTFNTADFVRFTEVKVYSPDDIVQGRFVQ